MLKVFNKVFDPEKLQNSIISGVDKAFFTKEEKMDYLAKFLKLYEPYKLAQRILAFMFSGTFLFIHAITAIVHVAYVFKELDTAPVLELYRYNNENLGTIVLMIVGFYFAGGLLEGTVNKFKRKNKKESNKN